MSVEKFFVFFIELLKYPIEVGVVCLLFSPKAEREKNFLPKTLIITSAYAMIAFISTVLRFTVFKQARYISDLFYTFGTIALIVWINVCYKKNIWDIFVSLLTGVIVKQITTRLTKVFLVPAEDAGVLPAWLASGRILRFAVAEAVFAAFLVIMYFCVGKQLREQKAVRPTKSIVAVYLLIMAANVILNMADRRILSIDITSWVIISIIGIIYNLLVLILQLYIFSQYKVLLEKNMLESMWKNDRKHYESLKRNMEIVNIKYHDLKYSANKKADPETLKDIDRYAGFAFTGNDALDVVLADKKAECDENGIALYCVADGRLISFMENTDVYAFFGNAFDNAIEYVSTLSDKDEKFISASVQKKNGFVVVRFENPFFGESNFVDGLPVTTKSNDSYHGFGTKSIKAVAEKYGGFVNFFVSDEEFILTATFTLPE